MSEASGFTNGAVGGDNGWAAAFFRFAVEAAFASEDGERMKMRKPTERTAASTSVIGFVRRIDLAIAIVNDCGAPKCWEVLESPSSSCHRAKCKCFLDLPPVTSRHASSL